MDAYGAAFAGTWKVKSCDRESCAVANGTDMLPVAAPEALQDRPLIPVSSVAETVTVAVSPGLYMTVVPGLVRARAGAPL